MSTLPPQLALQQLRMAALRETSRGVQDGINNTIRGMLDLERLKQEAADKKADRELREREITSMADLRRAEGESLRSWRDAQAEQMRSSEDRLRMKGLEDLRAAADKRDVENLGRVASGVDRGDQPMGTVPGVARDVTNIDPSVGPARSMGESADRSAKLGDALVSLGGIMEDEPEALAMHERAKMAGSNRSFGETRGMLAENLAARDKAMLDIEGLRAEANRKDADAYRMRAQGRMYDRRARGGGARAGAGGRDRQLELMIDAALKSGQMDATMANNITSQVQRLEQTKNQLLRPPPPGMRLSEEDIAARQARAAEIDRQLGILEERLVELGQPGADTRRLVGAIFGGENPFMPPPAPQEPALEPDPEMSIGEPAQIPEREQPGLLDSIMGRIRGLGASAAEGAAPAARAFSRPNPVARAARGAAPAPMQAPQAMGPTQPQQIAPGVMSNSNMLGAADHGSLEITVTNGRETMVIPASDEASAAREGFYRIGR